MYKAISDQVGACFFADLMRLMSFHRMCFANKYKIALCYSLYFVLLIPRNGSVCPESFGKALECGSLRRRRRRTYEGGEGRLALVSQLILASLFQAPS